MLKIVSHLLNIFQLYKVFLVQNVYAYIRSPLGSIICGETTFKFICLFLTGSAPTKLVSFHLSKPPLTKPNPIQCPSSGE